MGTKISGLLNLEVYHAAETSRFLIVMQLFVSMLICHTYQHQMAYKHLILIILTRNKK